jgi:hypothetical protein
MTCSRECRAYAHNAWVLMRAWQLEMHGYIYTEGPIYG